MARALSMPSVTSIRCIEARSICEYDLIAATSPEIRWVDSFISESKAAMENVLATHSSPGSRAGPASAVAARSHQARSTPAAASGGAMSQSRATPCRPATWTGRPRGRLGQRVLDHRARLDLAAQRIELGELMREISSRASTLSEDSSVWQASSSASTAREAAACRVVDLMRETSGERAQGDQGLPLPGRRLNGPGGEYSIRIGSPPNGNQALTFSLSTSAGTRSTRPPVAPRPVAR